MRCAPAEIYSFRENQTSSAEKESSTGARQSLVNELERDSHPRLGFQPPVAVVIAARAGVRMLAVVPYVVIRGLANRISRRLARREWSSGKAHPRVAKKGI